jgi:purine-cytosine permease-like protein
MKAYYYLLYRIYKFYTDQIKEKSGIMFSITAVSSVLIFFVLFTIYGFLNYLDLIPNFLDEKYVIIAMILIALVNYYFFIRKKRFLNYNFKKDFKGGASIVFFILVIAISYITVANFNRNKIFSNKKIEQEGSKPSLEGRIRKWFSK